MSQQITNRPLIIFHMKYFLHNVVFRFPNKRNFCSNSLALFLPKFRTVFDGVAKDLKFTSNVDWYNIKRTDLDGASDALDIIKYFFNDSLIDAIITIYPEQTWKLWKFQRVPTGFWKDMKNQRYDFVNSKYFVNFFFLTMKEIIWIG